MSGEGVGGWRLEAAWGRRVAVDPPHWEGGDQLAQGLSIFIHNY